MSLTKRPNGWKVVGRMCATLIVVSTMGASLGIAQDSEGPAAGNKRYALVTLGEDILRIDRQAGSVSFCRKANDIWRCMPAPLAEDAYQAEIAALADEVDRLKTEVVALRQALGQARSNGGQTAEPESGAPGSVSPNVTSPETEAPLTPSSPSQSPDEEASIAPPDAGVTGAGSDPAASEEIEPDQQAETAGGADDQPVQQPAGENPVATPDANVAEGSDTSALGSDRSSVKDEESLEQMLEFSERAMRRFFGLMKDLKEEMDRAEGK